MSDKKQLSTFISQKRREAGLTQSELAQILFVTDSAVSKWERGVSYPDVTVIPKLCETLKITEHEFFLAAEDERGREIAHHAHIYERATKSYHLLFIGGYALALLICFICNLAVERRLSWWFVVLGSLLTAFSVTNLPFIVNRKEVLKKLPAYFRDSRLLTSTAGILVSVIILLCICRMTYSGGGAWLLTAVTALLFGFSVAVIPFTYKAMPGSLNGFKGLLILGVQTALLYALIGTRVVAGDYDIAWLLKTAYPVATYCVVHVFVIFAVIRYLKTNLFFKLSLISLVLCELYTMIEVVIESVFEGRWIGNVLSNYDVFNGNFIGDRIIATVLLGSFAALAVAGIFRQIQKQRK